MLAAHRGSIASPILNAPQSAGRRRESLILTPARAPRSRCLPLPKSRNYFTSNVAMSLSVHRAAKKRMNFCDFVPPISSHSFSFLSLPLTRHTATLARFSAVQWHAGRDWPRVMLLVQRTSGTRPRPNISNRREDRAISWPRRRHFAKVSARPGQLIMLDFAATALRR